MNRRMYVFAFVMGCCLVSKAELSADERRMLAQAFASTNTPCCVEEMVYPVLSNCWFSLANTNPGHSRELQYHVLTNTCSFNSGDVRYWAWHGMLFRSWLFSMQCSFPCSTNDLAYLEQCADFLGREMVSVASRSDLSARAVFNYNCEVELNRKRMIKSFLPLVGRYEKYLSDDEVPSFRSNITTRARLTEAERRIVWPAQ